VIVADMLHCYITEDQEPGVPSGLIRDNNGLKDPMIAEEVRYEYFK